MAGLSDFAPWLLAHYDLDLTFSSSSDMSTMSDVSSNGVPLEDVPEPETTSCPKFELTWQDLRFCTQYVNDNCWTTTPIPTILDTFPENIVISQQLQQILSWSLQRLNDTLTDQSTSGRNDDGADDAPTITRQSLLTRSNTVVPSVKIACDDTSPAPVRTKSQKALPLVARLNKLRQDVASKIASSTSSASTSTGNAQPSSSSQAIAEEANALSECISCFDEFSKKDLVHLTCSHDYCKPCLREVVFTAMKNEAAFPPKCCLTEIALKTVLVCLDNKQRAEYKEKAAEYAIPAGHRWYCPEPRCSKWIRPESLHRNRREQQTCPHCSANICSMCRSLAHDTNQDCPQDFGLESTLEIAESEGWRRCYSCRTMVELTTGCRHITCRCGAEFCYVCNARWRTCNCTEADKERRIRELRAQREQRTQMQEEERRRQEEEDEAARLEAEEMAEAIRQVEEMERQDAIRRVEEERQRQLEEELVLAQLEEARLLEEIARREEEEEAERQFREILITSSKEECQAMMKTLVQIINYQHATLMSSHAAQEQSTIEEYEFKKAQQASQADTMLGWLQENVNRRTLALNTKQQSEWEVLLLQTENEEDELFMHMHMHLRGKPNREQREKRMRDAFQRQQHEKTDKLQQRQQVERQRVELGVRYEFEGLRKAASVRAEPLEKERSKALERLGGQVGCDRQWLQVVSTRRINLLNEHKRIVLQQLEAEEDPVGLTEEQARLVEPNIPAADDGAAGSSSIEAPLTNDQQHSQIETTDLYTASSDDTTAVCSPTESTTLGRSDTVIRSVPGAFPTLITAPTQSRPQSESQSQSSIPTSIMDRPRPRTSKSTQSPTSPSSASSSTPTPTTQASLNNITETAATTTTSSPVKRKSRPTSSTTCLSTLIDNLPANDANASTTTLSPAITNSPSSKHSSTVSHSSTSTSESTNTETSATSTDTSPSILDDIPANVIARHSQNIDNKKGKGSLGGFFRLGKKKELSEEEIRRRMSTRAAVGDGWSGWALG